MLGPAHQGTNRRTAVGWRTGGGVQTAGHCLRHGAGRESKAAGDPACLTDTFIHSLQSFLHRVGLAQTRSPADSTKGRTCRPWRSPPAAAAGPRPRPPPSPAAAGPLPRAAPPPGRSSAPPPGDGAAPPRRGLRPRLGGGGVWGTHSWGFSLRDSSKFLPTFCVLLEYGTSFSASQVTQQGP